MAGAKDEGDAISSSGDGVFRNTLKVIRSANSKCCSTLIPPGS